MNPYNINIQDIWATTDEKLIHMMQKQKKGKKSKNKIFTQNVITSSEESSPSDSDSSSEDSFVALRQEFRPNSTVSKSPATQRRHVEPPVTPNQSSNTPLTKLIKDKCSNDQASPSENSLPVQHETSFQMFLSNAKENKELKKEEKLEKQRYKTDGRDTPENSSEFEVMNKGSKLDRQYINNKLLRNGKNSVISGNSKVSHSRAPATSNYKKKADFQCVTVSEHVSQTRIIEIDVAQLSTMKNTTGDKNNVPKLQEKINRRNHPRKQNIKNEICTSYKKSNKTFSQNNLSNLFIKGEYVKWNSSLELNSINQPLQAHSMVTTRTGGVKYKKKTNDKIEWTTTQEESTQISVTRSSNKNNMPHQLTYNNKIKDVNYSQNHFLGSSISKNKLRHVKFNDKEMDIQNKNSNTFLKQNKRQIIWETTCHPEDFHKNNLLEWDEDENFNKKFQSHSDHRDEKQDVHDKSYTTREKSQEICCCGSLNKEQTFRKSKGTEETKYDRFEDGPYQINQDLISEKKILNSKPENFLIFEQKNPLIDCGKDISDLIIGSHIAISTFFSFYAEWKQSRCELIYQFEQLDKNIVETSNKYKKYQDMSKVLNGLVMVTASIPHPYVAMASKIVSFFSGLAMLIFGKSDDRKVGMDVPDIMTSLFRDMDASSDLYMYGLQCNQQLEETTKLIEKFHSNAVNHEFDNECSDRDILTFLQGIVDYNPKHRTFYKKLHKSFQELLQKESTLCRRFCEPFQLDSSNSVDVIGYLDWRFVNINYESVKNELEEIHILIQNNSTTMTDLAARMKNCIRILNDELRSAERCVSTVSLFHTSFETLKLDSK